MLISTHHLAVMLANFGSPMEIIVILVVALLLFGGKKLPEVARGLGKGLRTFKEELQGIQSHITNAVQDDHSTPSRHSESHIGDSQAAASLGAPAATESHLAAPAAVESPAAQGQPVPAAMESPVAPNQPTPATQEHAGATKA